ncbi:MAG TPA: primosomal protein N' [Syntrophales bacterium]|nr:primosomal protein N' [Syntrophales bacterium]
MFVTVAVNIPAEKTFTYSVPETLRDEIAVGKRVLVPFGRRRITGYVIESSGVTPCGETKDIIEVLDSEPLFTEEDLKFYRWTAQYYIYPIGRALSEILPGGINPRSDSWISISPETMQKKDIISTPTLRSLVQCVNKFPGGLPLSRLKKLLGKKTLGRDIKVLADKGLVVIEERTGSPKVSRKKRLLVQLARHDTDLTRLSKKQVSIIEFVRSHAPCPMDLLRKEFKNVLPTIRIMEQRGIVQMSEEEVSRSHGQDPDIGRDTAFTPNEDQEDAHREILDCMRSNKFSPCLLHGVTGSGKTEVYLQAIAEALRMKGGVIFLIPEIALTPLLISRFTRRFRSQKIAVLHSGIPKTARYDQWRRIQKGDVSMVIGARSAIFAPVRNLKLIIVDEEHDTSYKQDDRMRYNARDLAVMKANIHSATVVLGSATPSVQTYFNTMKGRYKYLVLPERVEDRPLPTVEVIDMKREAEESNDASQILSRSLREAIRDTLKKKQQTLLFLNRRGSYTFIFCFDCGYVFKCLNCAVSMTYHASEGNLKCHYCDYVVSPSVSCPECKGKRIRSYGLGTEKLEEEVKRLFPLARIARMDSDTTSKRGSHERILTAFDRRDIDILVGTQMIAKGHDFPYVTLVGVISADTSLNIPDFRAAERTFQLLTQVSGRGGRGESPGRVIVQTFNPGHCAIVRAKNHDYMGFYDDELVLRDSLAYPPFTRIVNLQCSSLSKARGIEALRKLKDSLSAHRLKGKVVAIGPAESPISRIKGRYRWQLLLKGKDIRTVHALARDIISGVSGTALDIRVDVDPLNFM